MAGNLTAMIAAAFSGGGAPPVTTDPYFEYTTLLLPGNGTNGAQNNTFLDGSTNNFTITRNGNTTQGTFSPFSQTGWGNYFDGSGDSLGLPTNASFAMETGDFTIEFWLYTSNVAQGGYIIQTDTVSSTNSLYISFQSSALKLTNAASVFASTPTLSNNTWVHIALVRTGTSVVFYTNGVAGSSATCAVNFTQGSAGIGLQNFIGYLSNFRIVKGTAVYTSNFTPPTSPLTAISGTSLLTCQSNRFIDNSSNNFAITKNGDTSVVAFSPFNPSASWSAATYGGSGYFDGTGDYLETPDSAALHLGTGDFTVEFWLYSQAASTQAALYFQNSGNYELGIQISAGNNIVAASYTSGGSTNFTITSSSTIATNTWYHFALVRLGTGSNNVVMYINGVSVGTATYTGTMTNGTAGGYRIGRLYTTGTAYFNGYLADLRVVKGTAVYTAAFTPPTAPLTAITNTSLLLNFTNAGIYDATSKNDLETVGNAQISTAISAKWGSGSMYFDGTGDYLQQPLTNLLSFAENTYTIEAWIYPTTSSGYRRIFSTSTSAAANVGYLALVVNGTSLVGETRPTNGGAVTTISGGTVNANTWYHAALSVNNGSARLFLDGVQIGSTTSFSALATMNYVTVGAILYNSGASTTDFFTGYIQDLRITKGYARYTANFTAPTAAFPTL